MSGSNDIPAGAETFSFGDSPEMSERLLGLIRSGRKTATCAGLHDFAGDPLPTVGQRIVATDWNGDPALLIEMTEVTLRRFCDVDADFALAEGEDETLAGWQAGHRAYFERNGDWSADMELVCERFALIEDLA